MARPIPVNPHSGIIRSLRRRPRDFVGAVTLSELPANFWWLWASGTFVPVATGVFLALAGAPAALSVLTIVFGLITLGTNIAIAFSTSGYSTGDLARSGRTVAVVTGWLGVAIVGIALFIIFLAVVLAVLFGAALIAALAGAGRG